jgi:hypothetical protein
MDSAFATEFPPGQVVVQMLSYIGENIDGGPHDVRELVARWISSTTPKTVQENG